MSLLRIDPSVDNVVRLDGDGRSRHPFVVTVAWEYDEERYLLWSSYVNPVAPDFEPIVKRIRDEAFTITDIKAV